MDSAWLCLCGALVMFMHAGFAMLETGSCRAKNASNVLMKNLVNVAYLANGRASNFWLNVFWFIFESLNFSWSRLLSKRGYGGYLGMVGLWLGVRIWQPG